jgi:hypothetical protein
MQTEHSALAEIFDTDAARRFCVTEPKNWPALSVKQPWAALIAAGLKTIEVRTWATRLRGPVLIHAAKIPDNRPEAWAWIKSPALAEACDWRGGIVAIADLVDCVDYRSAEQFHGDRRHHCNESAWFRSPVMYGFEFANVRPVNFVPLKGQTLFFTVKGFTPS